MHRKRIVVDWVKLVVNREQFITIFDINSDDHVVWAYEKHISIKSSHFVCIPSIIIRENYWKWCEKTLKGRVACYSSNDNEEWWGFTEKEDIMIWMLRWS